MQFYNHPIIYDYRYFHLNFTKNECNEINLFKRELLVQTPKRTPTTYMYSHAYLFAYIYLHLHVATCIILIDSKSKIYHIKERNSKIIVFPSKLWQNAPSFIYQVIQIFLFFVSSTTPFHNVLSAECFLQIRCGAWMVAIDSPTSP